MTKRKYVPPRQLNNREEAQWLRGRDGDGVQATYSMGGEAEQTIFGYLSVNLVTDEGRPQILIIGSKAGFETEPLFEPALSVNLEGNTDIDLEEHYRGERGHLELRRGTHSLTLEIGPVEGP